MLSEKKCEKMIAKIKNREIFVQRGPTRRNLEDFTSVPPYSCPLEANIHIPENIRCIIFVIYSNVVSSIDNTLFYNPINIHS